MTAPIIDRHVGAATLEVVPGEARSFRVRNADEAGDPLASLGTWTARAGDGYPVEGTIEVDGADLLVTFDADTTAGIVGEPWRLFLNGHQALGGRVTQALPQSDPLGSVTVEVDLGESIIEVTVVAAAGVGTIAAEDVDTSDTDTGSWIDEAWGTHPVDLAEMLSAIDIAGYGTYQYALAGSTLADAMGLPAIINAPTDTAPTTDNLVTTVNLDDDVAITSITAGPGSQSLPVRYWIVRSGPVGGHSLTWPAEVNEVGDVTVDSTPETLSIFELVYSAFDGVWSVARLAPPAGIELHAATHSADGSDPVEIETSQVIDLDAALDFRVTDDDPRLSDARPPTAHTQADETIVVGAGTLPITEARIIATLTDQAAANEALDRMVGNLAGGIDAAKYARSILTTETFAYPDGTMPPGFVTNARNGGTRVALSPAFLEGEVKFASGRLTRVIPPPAGSVSTHPATLLVENAGTRVRVEATIDGVIGAAANHFVFLVALHSSTVGSLASIAARVAPNGMLQIIAFDAGGSGTNLGSTATNVFTNGARVWLEVRDGRVRSGIGYTQHLDVALPALPGSGLRAGVRLQGTTSQTYVDDLWIGAPCPTLPALHAASHADGGYDELALDASQITTGVLPIARLATGTPTGSKFVRDDGTLAEPASSGGAITEPPAVSGLYYTLGGPVAANASCSPDVAGMLIAHPVVLKAGTYDRLGVNLSAAAVATWRLGIYAHDPSTGRPGARLLDAGTLSTNATGNVDIVAAFTAPADGVYWFAVLVDAYTARASSWGWNGAANATPMLPWISRRSIAGVGGRTAFVPVVTGVATGALPNPYPAGGPGWGDQCPQVLARKA